MTAPAPLLSVEGLTVRYGAVVAVRDLTFDLLPGRTLAVLGANGAGKTSLLRAITGLEPSTGRIRIDGQDVSGRPAHRIARQGVAHVPDSRAIFPSLSVADNLRMGLYGAGREDRASEALAGIHDLFPVLAERADQTAGTMSGGQQQMLTIARALVQSPRLLLIDEMSMGLAPAIVDDLFDVIRRLQRQGMTIVLVEQFVGQALGVADDVLVLEQGRTVAAGTPAELASDDLAGAYLGGAEVDQDLAIDVPPPPAHVTETVDVTLGPRDLRRLERRAAQAGTTVAALLAGAAATLTDEGERA
jgi:branched-chain amino acid transport system ATP-binding protein